MSSSTTTQDANRTERPAPPPPPPKVADAKELQPAVERNVDALERGRSARPSSTALHRADPPMPGAHQRARPTVEGRPQRPPPRREPTTREHADTALRETRPPRPNDPMQRHLDTTRAQLRADGLPASAPDVRVVVSDSDPRGHGNSVLRAAVGPVGPGQGAESHLQVPRHERVDALYDGMDPRGREGLDDLGRRGVDILEAYVQDHRSELGRVRETARQDPSRPTVAVMSWGGTVQQTAQNLAERAVMAPRGSQLHNDITRALGRPPTPRDVPAVARMLAERMQRRMDDPQGGQALRDAKDALGRDLRDASEQDRVTVFTSMGNSHDSASAMGNPAWGASVIHDVPGHISVGASTLGDPTRVGDERVTDFSSGGQVEVAAPGVQSPVGPPGRDGRPERIDGTSFSTPYAAGVAALMLQANPRLTTAQIQEVLQSTARNLPGERDGAGVIDPVAAVRRARELAAAQ